MKGHTIIVLIPFRSVGAYIIACLNSVFNQLYTNYEIYLLDDHSDDDTLESRIFGYDINRTNKFVIMHYIW